LLLGCSRASLDIERVEVGYVRGGEKPDDHHRRKCYERDVDDRARDLPGPFVTLPVQQLDENRDENRRKDTSKHKLIDDVRSGVGVVIGVRDAAGLGNSQGSRDCD
jgi:hypothetical protein